MVPYMFAVMLGGAVGTVCRYLLTEYMPRAKSGFSWGVVTANLAGTFLLAIISGVGLYFMVEKGNFPILPGLAGFGFCGALTTFSTFSTETIGLLRAGKAKAAAVYVSGSVITALLLVTALFIGFSLISS